MVTATAQPAPRLEQVGRAPGPRLPDAPLLNGRTASAVALLAQAASGLQQARRADEPTKRFAQARLAGLRAGAAVLATRAVPSRPVLAKRSRPSNVWVLLGHVAPELGEWSAFFAACAGTRAVTARDADDLLRQSEQFLVLAGRAAFPGGSWS